MKDDHSTVHRKYTVNNMQADQEKRSDWGSIGEEEEEDDDDVR